MTDIQDRGLKLAYFMLGIAVPLAAVLIWSKTDGFKLGRKARIDQARDLTVEDSFPASDPPSSW